MPVRRSVLRLRRARSAAATRPRRGAASRLTPTTALATSTITGPVGRPAAVALIQAPVAPETAPKTPARATTPPRRSVHWRAAAAGATTSALISTTPTVWRPVTMASTSSVVSATSSRRTGRPWAAAKSGSKRSTLNSFQKSSIATSARVPRAAIVSTSRGSRAAACPNRKRSRPAWPASGRRCTSVSSTMPSPKKTLSTMPSAASNGTRLRRTTLVTASVPTQPATAAPAASVSGALLAVSRNASTTPGSAACEMASPRSDCPRSTA